MKFNYFLRTVLAYNFLLLLQISGEIVGARGDNGIPTAYSSIEKTKLQKVFSILIIYNDNFGKLGFEKYDMIMIVHTWNLDKDRSIIYAPYHYFSFEQW